MTAIPLCVDLDGTLILTDSLVESALLGLAEDFTLALRAPFWLLRGRAYLKHQLSARVLPNFSALPLNQPLVDYLHAQKQAGRTLILITAADIRIARGMAEQMGGLFDDVIASEGAVNLAGRNKAAELEKRFGNRGFDYAGNERRDLAVWAVSRRAIVVSSTPALAQQAAEACEVEKSFIVPRSRFEW